MCRIIVEKATGDDDAVSLICPGRGTMTLVGDDVTTGDTILPMDGGEVEDPDGDLTGDSLKISFFSEVAR